MKTLRSALYMTFLLLPCENNRAHCLNSTAAEVWRLCDGKRTVTEIAEAIAKESKSPIDEELVWLTLARLRKSGLLMPQKKQEEILVSRRRMVRRIGTAALALPAITSLLVPTPAEAASPCRHNLALCPQGNVQCCSNFCFAGHCVGG